MSTLRTGSKYLESLNDGRQVFLDGERVAEKDRGLVARLFSTTGGWPDESKVVDEIKRRNGNRA